MKVLHEFRLAKEPVDIVAYHPNHHANVKGVDKGWIVRIVESQDAPTEGETWFSIPSTDPKIHVVIVRDIQLP